jgi:hypothetical protein
MPDRLERVMANRLPLPEVDAEAIQ